MICQQCGQRPATVQITQTMNNQKAVVYLCDACAGAKQDLILDLPFNMGNLITSIMQNVYGMHQTPTVENNDQCECCGMTFEEFSSNGKFGCANCYEVFGQKIAPIFRRLHGSSNHTGKVPLSLNKQISAKIEIDALKAELNDAVSREEYEKAAELRDRIRLLENGEKVTGGEK